LEVACLRRSLPRRRRRRRGAPGLTFVPRLCVPDRPAGPISTGDTQEGECNT
jgi:hypothetical protein